MSRVMIAALVLGLSAFGLNAMAQEQRKACDELKGEIEAKIKKNGVEKDAQADGKVVGTCDGGTKKIVYKRG